MKYKLTKETLENISENDSSGYCHNCDHLGECDLREQEEVDGCTDWEG